MATDDARCCPCMAAEEAHDAQETGEDQFHYIEVRRETSVDYWLDPTELLLQPMVEPHGEDPLDPDPHSRALWTVSCERSSEDGPSVQATYLEDALKAWMRLWQVGR